MRAAVSRFPVLLFTLLLAAIGSPVAASAVTPSQTLACGDSWKTLTPPPPAGGGVATFFDVDGSSRSDVWVVGFSEEGFLRKALIDHWNGSTWTEFAVGEPGDFSTLRSVAVISATDAWAVGWKGNPNTGAPEGLAEHWDGAAWTEVAVPEPGVETHLFGVAAASPTRVIAVGQYLKHSITKTLAIRLRDGVWHRMTTPSVDNYSALQAVAVGGRRDAWAVGGSSGSGGSHVLALHWDGHSWVDTGAPNPGVYRNWLNGVDAIAPDDVWAVGSSENSDATRWWSAWHWDGTAWTAYEAGGTGNALDLQAVAHRAADDVRMVGTLAYGLSPMQAAHWDGSALSLDSVPALGPHYGGHLYGAAVIRGQLWAAGGIFNARRYFELRGLIARRCPA
jgi:hypothetical protein